MFAANDDWRKFYADEPPPMSSNIFDSPAIGRALSMRSSCYYPGSIIDQLRRSRVVKGKPSGAALRTTSRRDAGRYTVTTSFDSVDPSGEPNDTSGGSSDTDENHSSGRLPPATPEAQNSGAKSGEESKGQNSGTQTGENCNPVTQEVAQTQTGGGDGSALPPIQDAVVRRRPDRTELSPSSTDSDDSDMEIASCERVGKNNITSNAKTRKRRKKLTVNLAATRYEVGKG